MQDPYALIRNDINHPLVRAVIRREIWALLRQSGLVSDPKPPQPNDPPRHEIWTTLYRARLVDTPEPIPLNKLR